MAVGATIISGAFTTSAGDRAKVKVFVEAEATFSGANVFVIPEANNASYWVGVVDGGRE